MQRIILAAMLLAAGPAFATEPPPKPEDDKDIFSIVFENDVFADTDNHYTNGVRFSWLSSQTNVPQWADWAANNLPLLDANGKRRASIAVGQNMYTPGNPTPSTPILNDQPYAGWLYGSAGVITDTEKSLDNLVLTLGVVGPLSHAEQTQMFIHKYITDSPHFNGWNNQLKNEPGIQLAYEHKWRSMYEFSPFGIGFDATPQAGFNLGNINTDVETGIMFRLGYDLPADYGPPRIRPSMAGSDFFIPSKELGGYLFGGVEGRAVGRNIFLDGNTFAQSQHVDKHYFVGSAQIGAAITYEAARLSYTHVFMTKEFVEQKRPEQFGALTLSVRF